MHSSFGPSGKPPAACAPLAIASTFQAFLNAKSPAAPGFSLRRTRARRPGLVINELEVGSDNGRLRHDHVGPHHLVVLMVGDVAVPDVGAEFAVVGRGVGDEGEVAPGPDRGLLWCPAYGDARDLAGECDDGVLWSCPPQLRRTGVATRAAGVAVSM